MQQPEALVAAFSALAWHALSARLIHLGKDLQVKIMLDCSAMPPQLASSYDELLFGGPLLSCIPGNVYEFTERYGTCLAALCLPDDTGYVILGPYLPDRAMDIGIDATLTKNGIPKNKQHLFLNFYEHLPLLGEDKIRSFLSCFSIAVFSVPISGEPFSPVDLGNEPAPCPVYEEDKAQMYAEIVKQRYARERQMLLQITRGDPEAIEKFFDSSLRFVRVPNRLRNGKNLFIVLNTLLRKAVEYANVHPFYIDRLSSRLAVRIEQLTPSDSLLTFRSEMVREYCELVRRHSLSRYSPNIRTAINYICMNLSTQLTLSCIAEKLAVNPTYLSSQFNREVGQSITEYISSKRVAESVDLLHGSKLNIAQVATAVGFSDANYFSRIFKQKMGLTPSEYKKQLP